MKTRQVAGLMGVVAGAAMLAGAGGVQERPSAWFAEALIGKEVLSEKGDRVAKLEELVIRPGAEPSYAVLSFPDWKAMDGRLFAMPWEVLRTETVEGESGRSKQRLVLEVERDGFAEAPNFPRGNWPDITDVAWTRELDAFYLAGSDAKADVTVVEAGAPQRVLAWRSADFRGSTVRSTDEKELGQLGKLTLDHDGRVVYAVLSLGGFMGLGERQVPIPWCQLAFARQEGSDGPITIRLDCTAKELAGAPQFVSGADHSEQMRDAEWIARVYAYFDAPEYGARGMSTSSGD